MKTSLLVLLSLGLFGGCDITTERLTAQNHPEATGEVKNSTPNASEAASTNSTAVPLVVHPPVAPPELPHPVQEVVRLAQTTLGDGVLLGYVDKIEEPYSLNADQIIYLKDLGLSEAVIRELVKQAGGQSNPASAHPTATPPSALPPSRSSEAGGGVIRDYLSSTASMAPGSEPGGTPPAPSVQYNTVPPTNYVVAPPAQPATQEVFYQTLSPYGVWVQDPDYGYVWQPTVAVVNPEWRPYCDDGSWVWSDCGWYWNSTYSWGWAPFHYGRWCYAPHRGWCWAPDTCWGPSWVCWRTCDSHCGWAPLPPHCAWSPAVGFTYYGSHVGVGFGFGLGSDAFIYVGWNRFCDPHPRRYCAGRTEVATLHNQTRVINDVRGNGNVVVNGNNNTVIINNGPGIAAVQAHTRSEIPRVSLADARTPQVQANAGRTGVTSSTLAVYRPNLSAVAASPVPVANRSAVVSRSPAAAPAVGPSRPYLGANLPRTEPSANLRTPSTAPAPGHPTTMPVNPVGSLTGTHTTLPQAGDNRTAAGRNEAQLPQRPQSYPAAPVARTEVGARPAQPNYESRIAPPAQGQTGRGALTGSPEREQPLPNTAVNGHRSGEPSELPAARPATGIFAAPGSINTHPGAEEYAHAPNVVRAPGLGNQSGPYFRYNQPVYGYPSQVGNNAPVVRYYNPSAPNPGYSAPTVNRGVSSGSSSPANHSAPSANHSTRTGH